VAGALSMIQDASGGLLVAGWIALIGAHVLALAHIVSRRKRAMRAARLAPAAPIPNLSSRLDTTVQVEKLFSVLDDAALSVERATQAHVAATKQLDSAEYLLQRLFDEFPMFGPARRQRPQLAPPIDQTADQAQQALAA
jgi:hypothetical protein